MPNIYGRWRVIRHLGGGGNAEVYVGEDQRGEVAEAVAVKVLHARKPDSEPYRRFCSEVAIHGQLSGRKGILPLLDANLPDAPSRENPAWLATLLATPIEQALGDRPEIRSVVEAVVQLAEVLATLAAEGISHRDLKPNNLYSYGGEYVLGDFGLVSYPGKEVVTEGGRAVGPIYFQAPEMIFTPETADGRPADVYSLAKTFWVLATGQRWPLPGEHRLDVPMILLQQLVGGERAEFLDHLIARSTQIPPAARPTMEEFARELRAWLAPPSSPTLGADLTQEAKRLDVLMAGRRQDEIYRRQHQVQFRATMERLEDTLSPIRERLVREGISEATLTRSNSTALQSVPLDRGTPGTTTSDGVSILLQMPGGGDPTFWCGVGLRMFEGGKLQIVASHRVRQPGQQHGQSLWHRAAMVQVGSAEAASLMVELVQSLAEQLPTAIAQYTLAVSDAVSAPLPLPKSGLTPNGQRLAAYLSTESAHALDTHLEIDVLVERLVIAERDLVDAAIELQQIGWVGLGRDVNSRYGVHSVVTKAGLFLETEGELRGSNPESDAVRFIADPVDAGKESLHVDERAKVLEWDPRRVNIACYFLSKYSGVERALESSTEPYAYTALWLGPASREFLRRHR